MKLISALLLTICLFSCKSPQLILSEGEITSDTHRNNQGLITFMNEVVPFEDYAETDFKEEVLINENQEFSIRIFLERTLTSYLNDLDPEMDVNTLCKKGNFELTFYVDGKEAYKEQLNPGAGSCWYKNSATAYRVPFINLEEVDHWGPYMWSRFISRSGGQDLMSMGRHDFKVEVRPYIQSKELLVGEVIASGEVVLKVSSVEVEVDEALTVIQKIAPNSGWELSAEEYDQELIRGLNGEMVTNRIKDIASIVVIKKGKLLIEEYFNGSDRKEKYNTRSVGKSFMSAAMGIAIDDGHIANEDVKISKFYDLSKFNNPSEAKANVSIKDLLTMSSGFDGDDGNMDSAGNEENMYPTKNWVKFGLDLPMREDREWTYFTAGSVILGDIIHSSVPGGLEKYADEKLLGPLGITDYEWQYTPQKVANTAGGIQMNALDFAKFGQLYKNKGKWNNKQVISEEWVRKSFERHATVNEETKEFYGYQFWEKIFTIDGKDHVVNYCTGTGGNKIYIFRDQPLVIVVASKAFRLPQAHSQVDRMMKKYILPATL